MIRWKWQPRRRALIGYVARTWSTTTGSRRWPVITTGSGTAPTSASPTNCGLCQYCIKDMQSEPNHQHHNYAERRIQKIKSTANIIINRVNAPNYTWFLCLKYVASLLNHLATPSLNNKTPIEAAFGVTPDISNLIQFNFYQPYFTWKQTNHHFLNQRNFLDIGLGWLTMLEMH